MTTHTLLITMFLSLQVCLLLLAAGSRVQSVKPTITTAMIGDYGMTTLAAAITRVQSEKGLAEYVAYEDIIHAEESHRGVVKYHQAIVEFETASRKYVLYDWDHQIDTIKALLLKDKLDAVILVVSPTYTVIPNIRIEVEMAYKVGVKNILVFINENNDAELVEQFQVTIRDLLEEEGFDGNGSPVISGSAHTALYQGDNRPIEELLAAMDSTIPLPTKDEDKPFLMQVSEYIPLSDDEILVQGKVHQGSVSNGDLVDLVGSSVQSATVKGLQESETTTIEMQLGLKPEESIADNTDWSIISEPGAIAPHTIFKAEVYFATAYEGGLRSKTVFVNDYNPTMKTDTEEYVGVNMRFSSSDTTYKAPGEYASVTLETDHPTPLHLYQHFGLMESMHTVAFGVITEILE